MVIPKVFHRLVLVLLFVCAGIAAQAQGFAIQKFHVAVDLQSSGTMRVEERIQVQFSEVKRGIYRVVPYRYAVDNGRYREVKISDISVTNESGAGLTTHVTREDGGVNIRIGDEAIFLPPGTEITYVIRYSVRGMLNNFGSGNGWDAWTELYWNSFGYKWLSGIERAQIDIRFPMVAEGKQVRLNVLPGYYGSRNGIGLDAPGQKTTDRFKISLTRSSAQIIALQPLDMGEDVTFVLGIPQGMIEGPTVAEQIKDFIHPVAGFLVPLILLMVGSVVWAAFGRDPWAGRLQVAFDPPDKLSPAHFGALIDEKVDPRDFSAGLVGLAVKGRIKIHSVDTGNGRALSIEVLKDPGIKPLSEFEQKLLKILSDTGTFINEIEMRTLVAPRTPSLARDIYDNLVSFGYYLASPDLVRSNAAAGYVVLAIAAYFGVYALFPDAELWASILAGLLSLGLVVLFTRLMPRATLKGANAKAHARGFAHFLKTREQYHEWFAQQHAPQEIFEEYLPYAVALGLEADWIRSFNKILQAPPDWYVDSDPTMDSFSRSFGWSSYTMAHSVSTPYRESSSSGTTWGGGGGGSSWGGDSGFSGGGGGGGFSGGGFGGGGGGSW